MSELLPNEAAQALGIVIAGIPGVEFVGSETGEDHFGMFFRVRTMAGATALGAICAPVFPDWILWVSGATEDGLIFCLAFTGADRVTMPPPRILEIVTEKFAQDDRRKLEETAPASWRVM